MGLTISDSLLDGIKTWATPAPKAPGQALNAGLSSPSVPPPSSFTMGPGSAMNLGLPGNAPVLSGGLSQVPSVNFPGIQSPFGGSTGSFNYQAPVAPRPPTYDLSFGGSTAAINPFYQSKYSVPNFDQPQAGDIYSQYGGLGNVPAETLNKQYPGIGGALTNPALWDLSQAPVIGPYARPAYQFAQDKVLPTVPGAGGALSGVSNIADWAAPKLGLPTTEDIAMGVLSPGGLALTAGTAGLFPGSASSFGGAFGRELLGDIAGETVGQSLANKTGYGGALGAALVPLVGGSAAAGLTEGLVEGARRAPSAIGEAGQAAARNIDVAQPTVTQRLLSGAIDPETGRPMDYQRILGAADEGAPRPIDVATGVLKPAELKAEAPDYKPQTISSIMQRYEGDVGTAKLELDRTMADGRQLLQQAGTKGTWDGSRFKVSETPEMVQLYKALHGEGPVLPQYQSVYDDLQRLVAQETGDTLGANPDFIPRDDYFYRGWKQPSQAKVGGKGMVGVTPGYQKPRVDATFTELLDEGWQPASWNPYEMIALRRRAGVEYRAQQDVVSMLRESGQAMPADTAPSNWRVPKVGPAFEGKPFSYIPGAKPGDAIDRLAAADELSGASIGYTSRIAVPNKAADILESVYGQRANLGALQPVLTAGQRLKQAKLLASLFQQVDFTGRTIGSLTGGAIDNLTESVISAAKLQPVAAARHLYQTGRNLLQVPAAPFRLLHANVSGAEQRRILDAILDSTDAIVKDRPGVTLRSIAQQGGFADDISIITRDVLADIRAAADEGPPSWLRQATDKTDVVTRRIRQVNAASQNGLFDGVYRQAKVLSLKNDIVPRLVRQRPDWSDEQIAQEAAKIVNTRFSTLTPSQSILKNPTIRELARGLIFSTNESEALIKGALSTVAGSNKRNWANYWLGAFISLAATAEVIHYASTGEHLPLDRLVPVEKSSYSPFGVSYNSKFLAPDLPIKGRNGVLTSLDLVAQLDTIFRVLDPKGFVQARENILPRALSNQITGKDFFGESLDSPQKRIEQGLSDLAEPIGLSQVRGALGLGKQQEARLGSKAQAFQASGLNLRAETSPDLRDRLARQYAEQNKIDGVAGWNDLEPSQRKDALATFPEIAAELEQRGEEAAQRGNEYALRSQQNNEIAATFEQAQLKDDAALGQNTLSPKQWKENRSDRQFALRQQRDVIFAGLPEGRERNAVERYYKAIDDATFDPTIRDGVDWDKVDAWMSQQSTADQKYIERNTGLGGTQQEKQYREQTKLIADSGYFDTADQLAAQYAQQFGIQATTRTELESYFRSAIVMAAKNDGMTATQINIVLPTYMQMYLGDYYSDLGKWHSAIREARPDIALALVETGRWEPGQEAASQLLPQTQ